MKYKNKLLAMLVIVMVAFVLVSCDNTPKPSTSAQIFIFEGGYIKGLTEDGKKMADIVIPSKIGDEDVIGIDTDAFAGCTGLTSIVIPDSVKTINGAAFKGCTGLASVTGMKNVSTIGSRAFMGCSALTSITIPSQVKTLLDHTFKDCTGLSSLTFDEGVPTLGFHTFVGCTKLAEIWIPKTVTTIGNGVFSSCESLAIINFGGTTSEWDKLENNGYQIWGSTGCPKGLAINCSDGKIQKKP